MVGKFKTLLALARVINRWPEEIDSFNTMTFADLSEVSDLLDYIDPDSDRHRRKAYLHGMWDAIDYMATKDARRHMVSYVDNELHEWVYGEGSGYYPIPKFEDWNTIRKRILDRDGAACQYCGGEATHVDHVVPVARGGNYQDDNLVAACQSCNLSKGTGAWPTNYAQT